MKPRNFATNYVAHSVFEKKSNLTGKLKAFANDQFHRFACTEAPTWEYFFHNGRPVYLERNENQAGGEGNGSILLKWVRGTDTYKDILAEASAMHVVDAEETTMIRRVYNGQWAAPIEKGRRSIDSVTIDLMDKARLLGSIDLYVEEGRDTWCASLGLPYRSGYFFYGPPGTGKTSCALAIAGYTQHDIYMMSFSDGEMDDNNLLNLMYEVPKPSIILFEDIDSAGIRRDFDDEDLDCDDSDAADHDAAQLDDEGNETQSTNRHVTFSELLNAIDGTDAPEGHIVVMTTNHREKLDPALFRSGRCDNRIYFGMATKFVAREMFARVLKPAVQPEEHDDAGRHTNTLESTEIDDLAAEFAKKIPELEFSPADILSYLRGHVYDPRKAVDEAECWMDRLREESKEQKLEVEREAERRRIKREAKIKRAAARKADKAQAKVREEQESRRAVALQQQPDVLAWQTHDNEGSNIDGGGRGQGNDAQRHARGGGARSRVSRKKRRDNTVAIGPRGDSQITLVTQQDGSFQYGGNGRGRGHGRGDYQRGGGLARVGWWD
jgi:chaperone BCS1